MHKNNNILHILIEKRDNIMKEIEYANFLMYLATKKAVMLNDKLTDINKKISESRDAVATC